MNPSQVIKNHLHTFLFVLFSLGLFGIFFTFLGNFGLGESGYNFLGKTKKITLSPGIPITQTFTAKEDHMHQLRLVLGNVSLKEGEYIEFRLQDAFCRETLAMTRLSQEPRSQGVYTVFPFPVIPHSQGIHYCFAATYFSSENRKGDKPTLSATEDPDLTFADRTLSDGNKNKVYKSQTLFLRPAYTSGSLLGDLWQLVLRLSQYKPAFLKGWPIVFLFGIITLGSIALAALLIFIKNSQATKDHS